MMQPGDYDQLLSDTLDAITRGASSVAILGFNEIGLKLVGSLQQAACDSAIRAIYTSNPVGESLRCGVNLLRMSSLSDTEHDLLVVAADAEKEELLSAALPYVVGAPKVIVAGYAHFQFRDPRFQRILSNLLVPSLANGYPNTLVHLYQCLTNAARLELSGVVAEFGMFKGGTTMFLSRVIRELGMNWPVLGFDTFTGFPKRRTMLDMYDHEGCVFTDLAAVRRYVEAENVEIVTGDIVETCKRLDRESVVLAFVDTDNYSPATAVIEVLSRRTAVGGAIVFDHFTGVNRFRYTLGERMAAASLLNDDRFFNLHGTGVFYRQR